MIRVSRSRSKKPIDLVGTQCDGSRERHKAEIFFREEGNRQKKLPGGYKVYKSPTVKAALNDLFYHKCAYCESTYVAVHPLEIEHYRPKGAVIHAGALRKPGYYWLAADWSNLLPSCIDCNRARYQETLEADADPVLSGKANLFPIRNEEKRGEYPGQEKEENRLLLDPCRDRPETHLEFRSDGSVAALSDKGQRSIDVYGLNRIGLIETRCGAITSIVNQQRQVTKAYKAARRRRSAARRSDLANQIRRLLWLHSDGQQYAAMARQINSRYLGRLEVKLLDRFSAYCAAATAELDVVEAFAIQHGTVDPSESLSPSDALDELDDA